FAFAVLFFQIAFISWYFIFLKKNQAKNSFLKIFVAVCFFALFVEVAHNIYFYTRVAANFKKYKSAVYREQDFSYYISLINGINEKYPGYEIWAAAPGDNFYSYLATYKGYIGIADAKRLKNDPPKVKTKTLLILMLYDHEIPEYSSFLSGATIFH